MNNALTQQSFIVVTFFDIVLTLSLLQIALWLEEAIFNASASAISSSFLSTFSVDFALCDF